MIKLLKKFNKQQILRLVIAVLVLVLIAAIAVIVSDKKDNSLKVYDKSLGLKYQIPEGFESIEKAKLSKLNPSFNFGAQSRADSNSNCIISQTKRPKGGTVTPDYLANGTYEVIKEGYPDAKIEASSPKNVGSQTGVLLEFSYKKEGEGYWRKMLVTASDSRTYFIFCETPDRLAGNFRTDFNDFLDSIKIIE